jgi:hypothetical protein
MNVSRISTGLLMAAVLGIAAACFVSGCQHTREAYNAADEPGDYAYVLAEHYSALLHEAVLLKRKPTTPRAAVELMQRVELKATPAVKRLGELRIAYMQVQNAQTEAELQGAINDAVLLIADMVRAIREARGGSVSILDPPPTRYAYLEAA